MKTLNQTQQTGRFSAVVIAILLACVGSPPDAQAVVPPPDGGYAGGNTAEGQNALLSLTIGTYNTAVGLFSLQSNQEGQFNTGVGAGTLLANTAHQNTAIGAGALLTNSTGVKNTHPGTLSSSQRYKEEITPIEKASEAIHSLKPVSFRYKRKSIQSVCSLLA